MNNMRIWSAAAVIALVLLLGFILSVPHAHDGGSRASATAATSTPVVSVHDTFKKGTHTIKISLAAPDACTSVTGQTSVEPASGSVSTSSPQASTPDTIVIALDMPPDSGATNAGATRWRIAGLPGKRWRLILERCRGGPPGEWEVTP